MKTSAYRSLPNAEKILVILGNLLDEKYVNSVLAFDMRQGETFSTINESIRSLPKELRNMVLLSLLNSTLGDMDLDESGPAK